MKEYSTSVTANLCTFARAYHSNFVRNKVFDDYLSYDLMGKDLYEKTGLLIQNKFLKEDFGCNENLCTASIIPELVEFIEPIPISRIVFFESELHGFADRFGNIQYVICGAGLGSFGFRNADKRIRVFEIDHPNTQEFKKERIRNLEWNSKELNFVPVDFSKDDMNASLLKNGFDPKVPAFFAIPGVSYYLTLPVLEETVRKIQNLSEAPALVCLDFPDDTTFKRRDDDRVTVLAKITERLSEKMTGTYSVSEMQDMFSRHGFMIEKHFDPQRIQESFFAGRSDGLRAFENVHFMTAKNF